MSDDKLYDALQRGQQAKELLESELLTETFSYMEQSYIKAWRNTPARDSIAREKLWLAVNQLTIFREHLVKVLNDGRLAQADLAMRHKKAA